MRGERERPLGKNEMEQKRNQEEGESLSQKNKTD